MINDLFYIFQWQYYTNLFGKDIKRNPTNVELFDIAQSNSEHSRHWFFNVSMTHNSTSYVVAWNNSCVSKVFRKTECCSIYCLHLLYYGFGTFICLNLYFASMATGKTVEGIFSVSYYAYFIFVSQGKLTIDGKPVPETLFSLVKDTWRANKNNSVIGFKDNSRCVSFALLISIYYIQELNH